MGALCALGRCTEAVTAAPDFCLQSGATTDCSIYRLALGQRKCQSIDGTNEYVQPIDTFSIASSLEMGIFLSFGSNLKCCYLGFSEILAHSEEAVQADMLAKL